MKAILLIMIGVNLLFGAEIFYDKDTGLEWQDNKAVKTVEKDWYDAKEYCTNLSLGGKKDWRLPHIKELLSIVDIKEYNPAVKSGIKNVASTLYWSASVYVSGSTRAWTVYFKDGGTYFYAQLDKRYVRCVRGRQ